MRGVIFCAVIFGCGCGVLSGLDALERASCDGACDEGDAATSDARTAEETSMGDGGTDSAVSDGSPRDGGADSCTAFSSPPTMILAGGTCIDSTEVRSADYALFLAAAVKPPPPDRCSWNVTFTPSGGWPTAAIYAADFPISNVDWCDAYAYCAWAGKRLCTAAEWSNSCSAGGSRLFPYGNGFKSTACNGAPVALDGSAPVKSFPDCVGGYPGIFDMSGNVLEWGDTCSDGGLPQNDPCAANGGDYGDPAVNLTCGTNDPHLRDVKQRNVGFRCCATP